jgi:hypothetical protein
LFAFAIFAAILDSMIVRATAFSMLAILLVGCGGGGDKSPVEPVSTQLKFKIAWTDNTRDVNAPATAQSASARIRVFGRDDVISSVNIDREVAGSYVGEYTTSGFGTTGTRYELAVLFFGVPRGYHGDSGGRTVAVVRKDVRVATDGTLTELDGKPLAPLEPVSTIASVKVAAQSFPFQKAVPVRTALKAFAPDGVELGLPAQVGEIETVSGATITKTPEGFVSQGFGRSMVRAKIGGVVSEPTEILTERTFALNPIDSSSFLLGGIPGGDLIGQEMAGDRKIVFSDPVTGARKFAGNTEGSIGQTSLSSNGQRLAVVGDIRYSWDNARPYHQVVDLQTRTVSASVTYDVAGWTSKSIAMDPVDDNLVVLTVQNGIAGRILAYRSGVLVASRDTRAGNVYATGANTFVMDNGPSEYPIEFSVIGNEVRVNRSGDRNPRILPFDAGVYHNGKIYYSDGMVLDTSTFLYSTPIALKGLWLDPVKNRMYGVVGTEIKEIDLATGTVGKTVSYLGNARSQPFAGYVAGDQTLYFGKSGVILP